MTITLSLPYDLNAEQWAKVDRFYQSLDGWRGYSKDNCPQWYGDETEEQFITASFEPSGLVVEGKMVEGFWAGWITVFCSRLSLALQMEIRDAEL